LIEEVADDPIQFISITSEKPALVEKFLAKRELLGWVGSDTDGSILEDYGVDGIPDVVVIDRQGDVVLRTRPEVLTAETLRAIAAGTFTPPAAREEDVESAGAGDLPVIEGFYPGVDPLWMPWIEAGLLREPEGFFFVTLMRPAVSGPGLSGGGYGMGSSGTGVGITITGYTAKEALALALRVPASHIAGDMGSETWDIVYSRPRGSSLDAAWRAVAELVLEVAGYESHPVEVERAVVVVEVDAARLIPGKEIDWEGDPTVKSLRSAAELVADYESTTGEFLVAGTAGLDDLYVDTFGTQLWQLEPAAYRAYLEGVGFSFESARRKVELVGVSRE
jgi:hypothetical protein